MKINRQIMKKKVLKKSQIYRNAYIFRISEFNNDQLMFLNENAINEHIMNQKHDWSSFEIAFSVIWSVKKLKKFNVLFVYTLNEILAYHIHQKLIINARFEWFFRKKIFFRYNAFFDFNSMLMMNNASIHHSKISVHQNVKYSY